MHNELDKALNMVRGAKRLAYDTETDGLDWKRGEVCGYVFTDEHEDLYIPVRHKRGGNILYPEAWETELALAMKDSEAVFIGHNLKFDMQFGLNHGIELPHGQVHIDTAVTEALLDENKWSYSLDNTAKKYEVQAKKGAELYQHISNEFDVPANKKSMGHFHMLAGDDPIAVDYAKGDGRTTLQVWDKQKIEVEAQELGPVWDLEMRLQRVLVDMERRGLAVQEDELDITLILVQEELEKLRSTLPNEFMNVKGRNDLEDYFRYHSISDWPITAHGNPSFAGHWLQTHKAGEAIIKVRKLEHFCTNFLDPLHFTHNFNGTLHTNFNQTRSDSYGTTTGRLSTDTPNMQASPKRDVYVGSMFRNLFKARPGYKLMEPDYSQCEPRLYANYSKEAKLITGYSATPNIDMHAIVQEILGVDRDRAKTINLAILYMMGAAKLAKALGITDDEAFVIMRSWYNLFPKVTNWRKRATLVAEQRGFVRTILGRRRRFPDPKWAYKAANAVIQGGSADIMKYKLLQCWEYLRTQPEGLGYMLLTIHDAILFEIHDSPEGEAVFQECVRIMEDVGSAPFNLTVPFKVDYKPGGPTWCEASYGKTLHELRNAA